MTPLTGLGADNVLSFDVVTPDGKLRHASPCEEPDLFWALRGGGGGTFGVVVRATHKLIKAPTHAVGMFVHWPGTDGLAEQFVEQVITTAPGRIELEQGAWGGVFINSNPSPGNPGGHTLSMVYLGESYSEATDSLGPIYEWYAAHGGGTAKVKGSEFVVYNKTDYWVSISELLPRLLGAPKSLLLRRAGLPRQQYRRHRNQHVGDGLAVTARGVCRRQRHGIRQDHRRHDAHRPVLPGPAPLRGRGLEVRSGGQADGGEQGHAPRLLGERRPSSRMHAVR